MSGFVKRESKKIVGELRKSKIVLGSGCGALVEFPGFSGIMGGQNMWDTRSTYGMRIQEKSLEEMLNKEYFLQVTSDWQSEQFDSPMYSVPVVRFPEYYYCPQCHELDYASRIAKNFRNDKTHVEPLICSRCGNIELIPSRFVMACEDGHIEDFPYSWWVHRGETEDCDRPRLTLEYKSTTGGLDSIIVSCETCKKTRSMANVLSKETTGMLKCRGKMPWLGKDYKCNCGKPLRALLRGASNIYYPETITALTIPPWSNVIQKVIAERYDALKGVLDVVDDDIEEQRKAFSRYFVKNELDRVVNCSPAEFAEQALLRFIRSGESQKSDEDLISDEYKAFISADIDDAYFKTETAELASELKPYFKSVKLVKRLRAVQVLTSFRRIFAYSEEGSKSAPLSSNNEKWLPATELLGEGIFIEFSEKKLAEWNANIGVRYTRMHGRYSNKRMESSYGTFSPSYVLIHTFSHLMIRQLAESCGYDSSSLCERLYVSEEGNMQGVLIYTASTCSDGSLGGLVRQGLCTNLRFAVMNMLEKARWCSNDPICIEAEEQGDKALNYAACHACALIPEISCQNNNILLDRAALVGVPDNREIGYFSPLI